MAAHREVKAGKMMTIRPLDYLAADLPRTARTTSVPRVLSGAEAAALHSRGGEPCVRAVESGLPARRRRYCFRRLC